MMSKEAMKLALEALENSIDLVREDAYEAEKLYGNYPTRQGKVNGLKVLADDHEKAIEEMRQAIAEAEQAQPVAKVCHDLEGHIGWNPALTELPSEGTELYTAPPAERTPRQPEQAQLEHGCHRSHPHENMDALCELRTEIARLTNENARLKAKQQSDEVNTYRMTLLCIRDGLQRGMSKSIQKLQAREINEVLGLPSFTSYRTSAPPATQERTPRQPLTDEQEREAFEAWAKEDPISWGTLERTKNGAVYRQTTTQCAFEGWQARAAHGIKGEA